MFLVEGIGLQLRLKNVLGRFEQFKTLVLVGFCKWLRQ